MPRLTIIVPLMDQVDKFETTLASVLRYAGSQVEVLAAIAGDYQDQYGILDEIGSVFVDFRLASTPLGRVALAADSATSTWIYWLSPGIEMTEDALEGALNSIQQRDLGLGSPRIVERTGTTEGSGCVGDDSGSRCLASSVVMTDRFHPVCLEDLVGEQWSAADLSPQVHVVGPTGWAGLVQRRLLEQWGSTGGLRLPSGYIELSLGLFVQQNGWSHQWISGNLSANEIIAADIEAGYRLCGRSSNRILQLANTTPRSSLYWRAVRVGLAEVARGCLSPQLWRVAWERLSGLRSLRQTSLHGRALDGRAISSGELVRDEDESGAEDVSRTKSSTPTSTVPTRKFRSAA